MGRLGQPHLILHHARARARLLWVKGPWSGALFEIAVFGLKQARACIFGGALLALILISFLHYRETFPLARYDALCIGALAIQLTLLICRLETLQEAKVILVFHLVGTAMEVFKTWAGSWVYPEPSLLRIGDVPLFSGFMYAAVGSYIARVWHIFDFRFDRFPPLYLQLALAGLSSGSGSMKPKGPCLC